MKDKAHYSVLLLCVFLCGIHIQAQCTLDIPSMNSFPCFHDADSIDYSEFGVPAGGTFSGPGFEPDGTFIPINAAQGPGSTAITEIITVTYTVDVGGTPCTATDQIELTIPEVVIIDPIPLIYCTDDPQIPLSASPGMGSLWSAFMINEIPPFGNDEFFPSFYGEGQHVIVYNFLQLGDGCFSRDSVVVEVYSQQGLEDLTQISTDPFPDLLCLDSNPIDFVPEPADGVLSGNGVVGTTFDPAIAGVGEHTIYFDYTTAQGSCSTVDSTTIVVTELMVDIGISANACAGEVDTLTYVGTPQDGSLEIVWDIVGASVETNIGDTILYVIADDLGTYDINLDVRGQVDCMQASLSDQVDKTGLVTVETIEDQIVGLDQETLTLFTNASSSDGSNISFDWSPPDGLDCSDCQDPVLTPDLDQQQTYTVTATDANGCVASDEVVIDVSFTKNVFVPNAFTPNGDGKNDLVYVYGQGIQSINFQVFDRWGTLVFETTDPKTGWAGLLAGEQLASAVYYYSLISTFIDGDERKQTGDITLIR